MFFDHRVDLRLGNVVDVVAKDLEADQGVDLVELRFADPLPL